MTEQIKQEEAEQSAAPASLLRIDGWVKYCEYFHLLDADMQATSQESAERYDKNCDYHRIYMGSSVQGVGSREHDACFAHIARALEQHDKPLELEGDEDLGAVHARLRAAAHSSNLRAAALVDELDVSREAEAMLRGAKPRKRASESGPRACAAAMETHLWFGLALGETAASGSTTSTQRPLSRSASGEWALDWCAAMSEAGLSDETEAKEALEALEAVEADEAQAAETHADAAEAEVEVDTVITPVHEFVKQEFVGAAGADETRRSACHAPGQAASDDRFESGSDGGQSESGSDYSFALASAEAAMDAAAVIACGDAATESGDETARASAPTENEDAQLGTRRSSRALKKPREWTSLQTAPLLKLEKLKKGKSSRSKRPCASGDYDTDSGCEELATPKTMACDEFALFYDVAIPSRPQQQTAPVNKRRR